MGEKVQLTAADGHSFSAYVASPAEGVRPIGGLLVLQEIFGVNSHIRSVVDRIADCGYQAVAPALFDRIETDVELRYEGVDLEKGKAYKAACDTGKNLLDVAAALGYIKQQSLKAGIIGFCWGGLLAWLCACRFDALSAVVTYYGGGMTDYIDLRPRCPVLSHFAANDQHIPVAGVKKFQAMQPGVEVHIYDAEHGFNCDQRGSFNAQAATLAWERTTAFLAQHIQPDWAKC